MNAGGHFKFKVGDRVLHVAECYGVAYPAQRARIVARTTEPALGKTYQIRYQNGRMGGYVPEDELTAID